MQDAASLNQLSTILMIALTVSVVGLAAVSLPGDDSTPLAQELHLDVAARMGPDGVNLSLRRAPGPDVDLGMLRVVVASGGVVRHDAFLGTTGEAWQAGDVRVLALSPPIAPGASADIVVTYEPTQDVAAVANVVVPRQASPDLSSFTVETLVDGASGQARVRANTSFLLEARISHVAGRKAVQAAYADLSALGGPSWVELRDDGTQGDAVAADGVYSAFPTVPRGTVYGMHSIVVQAVDLHATLVSAPRSILVPGPLVHMLNPSASKAIALSGSSCIFSDGDILVNSVSSTAIDTSSSGCPGYQPASVVALNGGQVLVAGGTSGGCCSPAAQSTLPIADPYASRQLPTYSSGTWYADGSALVPRTVPPAGTPMQPGVYSEISLSSAAWTMQPGVYVVDGGKLSLSGGASVSGTDVFIFVTNSAGTCRETVASGGSVLNLTGRTSGLYQGLVLAQDRACTTKLTLSGASGMQLMGTVYYPGGLVTLSGGSTMTTLRTQIVADRITISGGGFTFLQP